MISKSVQVKGPSKVELVTEQKVRASPGNVVVRVTLRPVNPCDIMTYTTMAQVYTAFKDRFVIGSDGVGYVEEVGEGVTKLKVGQRVVPAFFRLFYGQGNGSWQDYVEVSEDKVLVPPDSISDEVACQAIVNPWTAYGLAQNVPAGEWLIQTAAASQVGRQVIQLAKHFGFKTINVVRRDDVIDELKAIGGDVVINSAKEDVINKVREVTGGKLAYRGVDAIAGEGSKMVAACVRDGGQVFVYGLLSGADITISFTDINRVRVSWWEMHQIVPTPEKFQEVATEVFRLLAGKVIIPQPAIKRFSLEKFQDAVQLSQTVKRGGKVLLESLKTET